MLTLYGMQDSGNCYKPRLLLALIGRPFRHVELDPGETRRPEFLAKNPVGKVPLLELEDGRLLSEANAILCYLGEGSRYAPRESFERAKMLQWMFFEQYSHEPYLAVRRSLRVYAHRRAEATPERMGMLMAGGERALAVLEGALVETAFLLGERASLADIALYPYTDSAREGGFDLDLFPAVRAWLARVEDLPGFRPITWKPDAAR